MSALTEADFDAGESVHWRRNLAVCLAGSFTTLVAMSLLLPFLPFYIEELGVTDRTAVAQWSGAVYGVTFFAAGLVAPLWGRLADRYGRKLMLIRASLGMAIVMSLIGTAHDVWQLLFLRLLVGFLGGYSSGSITLVATQTPKSQAGWALGALTSGIMAGNLVGPLIGGFLPPLIGIRATFWLAGGVIFVAFLATTLLIKEAPRPAAARARAGGGWAALPDRRPIIAMLATGLMLMLANMSIEPIITLYVQELAVDPAKVTTFAGLAMSAAALGSILSASRLGRLADRVGHWTVIAGGLAACALLLIPQAFVTNAWQLVFLRFLTGLALGGLLPCIAAIIRHSAPDSIAGAMLGYSTSSQYAGQVVGPLAGGFIGGHFGMRAVFIATCLLMAAGSAFVWASRPRGSH
ncbi:MAG TPA: MFS transporter [Roseiarcus sp.]|jgi:MFS family permease|nr:MFS transporter [Roseiarcus sp.]